MWIVIIMKIQCNNIQSLHFNDTANVMLRWYGVITFAVYCQ